MKHPYALTLAVTLASPVSSQLATPIVLGPETQTSVLRAGTPIALRMLVELTTKGKHLKVGDRFSLEVVDSVSLNNHVVIPVGSNAVGEVTSIRNKGMWGKSGNIETRLLYLTANDRKIRISGSVGDKGVKAGGGAIATSAIVFLPAGFFMTGTSAVIPSGARVNAILDEDVPIVFASAPPTMTVPIPPAVVVPASAPQPSVTRQPMKTEAKGGPPF